MNSFTKACNALVIGSFIATVSVGGYGLYKHISSSPSSSVDKGLQETIDTGGAIGTAGYEPLTLDRLKSECMTSTPFSGTELNIECGNHLMALEQRRISGNNILTARGIATD